MNKEKIVWVKIKSSNYYNILLRLNEIGVEVFDNKYANNIIFLKISYQDYQKIKKYLVNYSVYIYEDTGIYKLKNYLSKYFIFTLSTILGIALLIIVNNMVFKIEIISSNNSIKNLLINELKNYGLSPMRFKKNHKQIEKIVSSILANNKNLLEWLEIKYDGLIMIVNVTEKTKIKENINYSNCDIIATTDAKINSLNVYRGVALKNINDYVLSGEVIISGSVIHNEEVKNTVCASGEVFGEVWYKANINMPLKEEYREYTGKKRYNLSIKIAKNKYDIFKSRLKNFSKDENNLYKLNDFEINLVKEKEYVKKVKYLTIDGATEKAINTIINRVKLKLKEDEEILMQKVLKKEANDSTIYLELFIVTKENVGKVVVVKENGSDGT